MGDSGQKYLDLSFIAEDVRNQLARSRDILSQVQELRKISSDIKDELTKAKIDDSISRLLSIANSLTSNAAATSASVESFVAPLFEQSRER